MPREAARPDTDGTERRPRHLIPNGKLAKRPDGACYHRPVTNVTPPPELHPALVLAAWDETPALRGLRLALPAPVAARHASPGQVVQARVPGGQAGYFALASAPGDLEAELLVKRGGRIADALIAHARPGASIELTPPIGSGFRLDEATGRDVLLFAAGSGITPIRALLRRLLAGGPLQRKVYLFYGQRDGGDFAYAKEHEGWRRAGVEILLVASRPGPGWTGATGHVQEAARRALPAERLSEAVAYVAGLPAMVAGVRETLAELGVPPERVHENR